MGLFVEVDGEVAIIVQGGKYTQTPVYTRDGYLYAKMGAGFIRLHSDGSTTLPKARLDHLTFDQPLGIDPLGRLCELAVVPSAKPIPQEKAQVLLGYEKD